MSQPPSEEAQPFKVRWYVLLYAGTHAPAALTLGKLAVSLKIDAPLLFGGFLIYACATFVGWRIASKHRRLLLRSEMRRLIAGCLIYIAAFDAFALWGLAGQTPKISTPMLIGAMFGFVVDFLYLWVSFRFGVQKTMERLLAKPASIAA